MRLLSSLPKRQIGMGLYVTIAIVYFTCHFTTVTNEYLSCGKVDEDVVEVPVAQADDVADHGHDSRGPRVVLCDLPPLTRARTRTPQLPAHNIHLQSQRD